MVYLSLDFLIPHVLSKMFTFLAMKETSTWCSRNKAFTQIASINKEKRWQVELKLFVSGSNPVHPSDWKIQASQCRLTSSDDICSSQLCQFWHLRVFSSFPDLSSSPTIWPWLGVG
jgi:hypothetical protein